MVDDALNIRGLKQRYDSLYISIGAHTDKETGIEGEDSLGVVSAVELLRHSGYGNFKGGRVEKW